ncbi:TetR/AcrR family transcriptional regulator [Streptomyces violens]|uniref:TetR/AcrR family transcriptional regulator n=1 Tax=Streptomyces violens TaxID=66377 RepID=UPI000565C038|nr:TetR/AcrR family transcriptional regulator [Streptomyces violens]
MSKSRVRGSYAVGRERRERIVKAATDLFSTAGYARTSMARVAQDVGISTTGLLHYFPTKQHLLLAVAEHRLDVATALMDASTEADGDSLIETLLAITKRFVDEPGLIELFVTLSAEAADPSSAAHELFAARYERTVGELSARFQSCARNGSFRTDIDYDAVARECVAVSDGLQLQWVLSGGRTDLLAGTRAHLERLTWTLRPARGVDPRAETSA